MKLTGSHYLGWRHLQRHKAKTALLTGALTLAVFLPVGVSLFVSQAETRLRARAVETPLLLGAPGSPLELVFNGLYFNQPELAPLTMRQMHETREGNWGHAIPLNARYHARGHRIVGTSLEYFTFRRLSIAQGTQMVRLGDCVLGASVARQWELGPGDHVISSPEALFDMAGVYPLKMRITGVLAPTGGADDRAIFTDVKTTWVISGLAHGHQDATKVSDNEVLGKAKDGTVTLNASVVEYNEITPDNVASFHFHGDSEDFPLTSAIILPRDHKGKTILLGRYQDRKGEVQLVEPPLVMDNLFTTVFQIRDVVVAALALVAGAALLISALVFALSHRLRQREFDSLKAIGADAASLRALILFEGGFVIVASLAMAGLLTAILRALAPWLVRLVAG